MKFIFKIAAPALVALAAGCSPARTAAPAPPAPSTDAQRLVSLLDYVAADYGLAVRDGRVASRDEYAEQVRFMSDAREIAHELTRSADDALVRSVDGIASLVAAKADAGGVAAACHQAREAALTRFGLPTAPAARPSLDRARSLYLQACATCHGDAGDARVEASGRMDPPPADFTDPERLDGLSPFRAYNAVTFGVPGTAMPSYESLSPDERWELAFYVFRLGHAGRPAAGPIARPLGELSARTDSELLGALRAEGTPEAAAALTFLRCDAPFQAPPAAAGIERTRGMVRQALVTYRDGAAREADRLVLDAYLQGFETLEPQLRARDASGTVAVETGFRALRGAIAQRDAGAVQVKAQALDRALGRLNEERQAAVPALAGFLVYFREGIEAALLVGALLGVLRRLGRPDAARWVHLGWIAALPAGALTWWLLERVIAAGARQRELIEAFVALLAAAVLFSVSFWMISRVESRHWMRYLRGRLEESLLGRRLWMLAGLSFLAVYREAAETVLFTQALLLDAGTQRGRVLLGCALGALTVAAVAALITRAAVRLPLGPFFAVSGVLLCALAVSFAGSGIYALVASGHLSPRPVDGPEVPWMGIYPDLTGLLVQSAIVAVVAGAALLTLRRRRAEPAPQA
jgi:high-affinity iron transporter